jgi:hypothetical protein
VVVDHVFSNPQNSDHITNTREALFLIRIAQLSEKNTIAVPLVYSDFGAKSPPIHHRWLRSATTLYYDSGCTGAKGRFLICAQHSDATFRNRSRRASNVSERSLIFIEFYQSSA